MFTRVYSATVVGVNSLSVEIEVDLKKGMPYQTIVGLVDTAIKEARERVNSAILNSGYDFPLGRLTVNLAPADIKKEGSIFDLPIAIGILISSGQIKPKCDLTSYIIIGELSLDGRIKPVNGILAVVEDAKRHGITNIILPYENYRESRLISGMSIYPVKHLKDGVEILSSEGRARESKINDLIYTIEKDIVSKNSDLQNSKNHSFSISKDSGFDFSDIKGQDYAIRAIEIAAAGGHNLLLIGSPGSGKTMLALRVPTILPDMTEKESIETTKIYSSAGLLNENSGLIQKRPFRSPHHSASEVSIIGGGKNPIPGEVTLAHNGVLFMDEFTEFKVSTIQALRQPLENGSVTISRADSRITFPSEFMLIASMNPCPCGYLFDDDHICRCTDKQINKYYMRISGPILDRIDIQVAVKPVKAELMMDDKPKYSSKVLKEKVFIAREIQQKRFNDYKIKSNARMTTDLIKEFCKLDSEMNDIMRKAANIYKLSARSFYKVLKVARTIADLRGKREINRDNIYEALSYREVESIIYLDRKQDMTKLLYNT